MNWNGFLTIVPKTLFDATIEENIRFSVPNATHEQVVEAAKQANAHAFIMEFPEGMVQYTCIVVRMRRFSHELVTKVITLL
jgi:ABC-type transport system involved in Fe-S cluster assembly fused permease/ATPase subunit